MIAAGQATHIAGVPFVSAPVRLLAMISAAAPISPENLRFLTGLDMLIREVYGQSEDCGPSFISLEGSTRIGAVGKPLAGTEIRIADDRKILVHGPHVFQGYMGRPDETARCDRKNVCGMSGLGEKH